MLFRCSRHTECSTIVVFHAEEKISSCELQVTYQFNSIASIYNLKEMLIHQCVTGYPNDITRTISLLATVGVQFANVFSVVVLVADQFGYDTEVLFNSLKPVTRYGGLLFYVGNFFLGIERAVAVLMVSKYEKCVSPLITSAIIIVTASVAGLTGTALNMLVAVYSVVPKLIFVLTYATLCFLALYIVARSLQINRKDECLAVTQELAPYVTLAHFDLWVMIR
ncbi:unnamed protein product [Heligmosomoides polygyrus]|uniref:Aa_trans domain-containing protein n=1 Tax=Heligmosomoides polygyrus TaxID=6339 RepID=A0A183G334_HELPZ|nr:unnamed protein product [Heligmosomoides polygyrus]